MSNEQLGVVNSRPNRQFCVDELRCLTPAIPASTTDDQTNKKNTKLNSSEGGANVKRIVLLKVTKQSPGLQKGPSCGLAGGMRIETHRDRYQGPKISILWKLNLEVNVYRETKTSGCAHHASMHHGRLGVHQTFQFQL